jgi:hypothetical protein
MRLSRHCCANRSNVFNVSTEMEMLDKKVIYLTEKTVKLPCGCTEKIIFINRSESVNSLKILERSCENGKNFEKRKYGDGSFRISIKSTQPNKKQISKLLQNALYGRLCMKNNRPKSSMTPRNGLRYAVVSFGHMTHKFQ